jgi:hypothetical protein
MIGSALSRLDTAEKLSIPQLQQAIQSGSIPAYMGVPLLEEKIAFEQRMRSAAAARMAQGQQPTIAEQVMDQAQMVDQGMIDEGGIDQLPIEAPEFAGGGIVAFEDGGQVQRFQNQGLVSDDMMLEQAIQMMVQKDPSFNTSLLRQAIADASPDERKRLIAQISDREAAKFMRQGQGVPGTGISSADMNRESAKFARQGQGVPGADTGIAPPMDEEVPVAPSGRSQMDIGSLVNQATRLTDALGFGPRPDEFVPTTEEASKQTTELLQKSGYDEGLLKRMGQDIAKQREGLDADRSEAKAYRLIEAGLGIMSGTSANAFENIGKGATPALKGLASDIKDIKKAEREYQLAEQNLLLKQNEAAMGKANITQGQIDKARERVDKRAENRDRAITNLTNTMLSGEIQKDIARNTYSKMTDFDKQWALYSKDAKDRNETPTFEGFRRALEGTRGVVTPKQASDMAIEFLKNTGIDMTSPDGKKQFEGLRNYFMQGGGGMTQGPRSQQDQQALAWANANPNDPRAKQIKEYLGVK